MLAFYTVFMVVFGICGTFVTNLAIFRQTEWSLQVTPLHSLHPGPGQPLLSDGIRISSWFAFIYVI